MDNWNCAHEVFVAAKGCLEAQHLGCPNVKAGIWGKSGGGRWGSLGSDVTRHQVRSQHHVQVDPIAGSCLYQVEKKNYQIRLYVNRFTSASDAGKLLWGLK